MGQTCRVCRHPQREEIERLTLLGEPKEGIERASEPRVSDDSIRYHERHCMGIVDRRADMLAQRRAALDAEIYRLRETAYNHADAAAADRQHHAVAPILSVAEHAVAFEQRALERAEVACGATGGGDGDDGAPWLEALAIRVGGRRPK